MKSSGEHAVRYEGSASRQPRAGAAGAVTCPICGAATANLRGDVPAANVKPKIRDRWPRAPANVRMVKTTILLWWNDSVSGFPLARCVDVPARRREHSSAILAAATMRPSSEVLYPNWACGVGGPRFVARAEESPEDNGDRRSTTGGLYPTGIREPAYRASYFGPRPFVGPINCPTGVPANCRSWRNVPF
jgi:hypothetical protein